MIHRSRKNVRGRKNGNEDFKHWVWQGRNYDGRTSGLEHLQKLQLLWVFLICRGQHLSNVVKEGAVVNQWQGSKNSLMHVGREGWPVWSNRTDAAAAQMAVKDDAGSDRTMSVPCSWLCMELSQRPVRVPKRIPIHCQKCQQWAREHQNWTTKQWKKVARSDESHFVLPHVDGRLHIHQGNTWHQDALWEAASGGGAMLYVMIYWETLGSAIYVDVTLICTTWTNKSDPWSPHLSAYRT